MDNEENQGYEIGQRVIGEGLFFRYGIVGSETRLIKPSEWKTL